MKYGRITLLAAVLAIACKPEPGSGEAKLSNDPTVVVEQQGEEPTCDLVEQNTDSALEIREHDDWLVLWRDRELDSEGEDPLADPLEARARACAMSEGFDDSLRCTDAGVQVLAIHVDNEVSVLVVEEREQGLRSVELSRWTQMMCRCGCGSRAELLGRDPLRVVVAEYEGVASEVHSEGNEIIVGCDEDDECTTACLGEAYGSQRLLVFGDSLALLSSYVDDSATSEGEFDVRFALDQGQLIATGECTQVLAD